MNAGPQDFILQDQQADPLLQLKREFPTAFAWKERIVFIPDLVGPSLAFPTRAEMSALQRYNHCVSISYKWRLDKTRQLFKLTANGDYLAIRALNIDRSYLTIQRQGDGFTPLHLAAFHGYTELIQDFLRWGSTPGLVCYAGCTPLHYAIAQGHREAVVAMLEYESVRANIHVTQNILGITPYFMAVEMEMADLFQQIDSRQMIGKQDFNIENDRATANDQIALAAIGIGAHRVLKQIGKLERRANLIFAKVHEFSSYRCSAMVLATISGLSSMVKLLLEAGGDPDAVISLPLVGLYFLVAVKDPLSECYLWFARIAKEADPDSKVRLYETQIKRFPVDTLQILANELERGERFGVPDDAFCECFSMMLKEYLQHYKEQLAAEANFEIICPTPTDLLQLKDPKQISTVFLELQKQCRQSPEKANRYVLMAWLYDNTISIQTDYPEFHLQLPFFKEACQSLPELEDQQKMAECFIALNEIYLYLFANQKREDLKDNFLDLLHIFLNPLLSKIDPRERIREKMAAVQKGKGFFKSVEAYQDCLTLIATAISNPKDYEFMRIAASAFFDYLRSRFTIANSFPQQLVRGHASGLFNVKRFELF